MGQCEACIIGTVMQYDPTNLLQIGHIYVLLYRTVQFPDSREWQADTCLSTEEGSKHGTHAAISRNIKNAF